MVSLRQFPLDLFSQRCFKVLSAGLRSGVLRETQRTALKLNHRLRMVATLSIVLLLLIIACFIGANAWKDYLIYRAGHRVVKEVHVGAGIACSVNGEIGPANYSVYDIGKPGVPTPSTEDLSMIHKIMKYVHPSTLRFAYLATMMVVYDSYPEGLCSEGAPYFVLNGNCNEFYPITDRPFSTVGGGEMGCTYAPRPWIPSDGGRGKIPWSAYDNSH